MPPEQNSGSLSREQCILLLIQKQQQLLAEGLQRYPARADFPDDTVCLIKARLGPWPRALEAAGLKERRDGDKAQKLLEKRIRAKRIRTEQKKRQKRAAAAPKDAE